MVCAPNSGQEEGPTLTRPDYIRPSRLECALDAAASGALVAAGCTDLFAATTRPELAADRILDITAIEALRGIRSGPEGWWIGATTPWSTVRTAGLPPAFDALRQSGREVGAVQIQNSATVGGNLCNASPAADGVPPLLILDAELELRSRAGSRRLPLTQFLLGPGQTALAPGEILVGIVIPEHAARGRSLFLKLGARTYLVISIAMIAARLVIENGTIAEAAISVGACSGVAVRLHAVEDALKGRPARPGVSSLVSGQAVTDALSPISDIRADAGYRDAAAAILVRRAIESLVREPVA